MLCCFSSLNTNLMLLLVLFPISLFLLLFFSLSQIFAYGTSPTLAYHKARGAASINLANCETTSLTSDSLSEVCMDQGGRDIYSGTFFMFTEPRTLGGLNVANFVSRLNCLLHFLASQVFLFLRQRYASSQHFGIILFRRTCRSFLNRRQLWPMGF